MEKEKASESTDEVIKRVQKECFDKYQQKINLLYYSIIGIFAVLLMFALIGSILYYYARNKRNRRLEDLPIKHISAECTFSSKA